jgi:hypothetical protein
MPLTQWFLDSSAPKNVVNNMSLYALDDLIFKVEIHINYGIFIPFAPLFANTTVIQIKSPERAKSIIGLKSYDTRQLTPYVSYEQKTVTMKYIFCAVLYASDPWSNPNNLPPQFSAYKTGRGLLAYNVSSESRTSLVINTQVFIFQFFFDSASLLFIHNFLLLFTFFLYLCLDMEILLEQIFATPLVTIYLNILFTFI